MTEVKGLYKNGKVELLEIPPDVAEAPVVITFMDQPHKKRGAIMTFGMFKGVDTSTLEDFKTTEFDAKKALEKWERANGNG